MQQLICGDYSEQDQRADPDLGKSLRSGFRNESTEGRVFGAPSIRTDLSAPKVKSVADNQNYGNEPDAFSLIYPSEALNGGLEEDEFVILKTKEELKEVFDQSGFLEGKAQDFFDAVFAYATQNSSTGLVSASEFLKAKRELDIKSLGF